MDLYFKSGQLVKFLQTWRGSSDSLAGRYEELMVQLYERDYVGEQVCSSVHLMPCIPVCNGTVADVKHTHKHCVTITDTAKIGSTPCNATCRLSLQVCHRGESLCATCT
jgi:hypothetical protein